MAKREGTFGNPSPGRVLLYQHMVTIGAPTRLSIGSWTAPGGRVPAETLITRSDAELASMHCSYEHGLWHLGSGFKS